MDKEMQVKKTQVKKLLLRLNSNEEVCKAARESLEREYGNQKEKTDLVWAERKKVFDRLKQNLLDEAKSMGCRICWNQNICVWEVDTDPKSNI